MATDVENKEKVSKAEKRAKAKTEAKVKTLDEGRAVAKYQRVSPRKTRIVARNVQGLGVEEAMNLLMFTHNKPAGILFQVVKSALANADQKSNLDVDKLIVKEVMVNEGPCWKRFMPRAQGRATKIRKRTSHITVILVEGR